MNITSHSIAYERSISVKRFLPRTRSRHAWRSRLLMTIGVLSITGVLALGFGSAFPTSSAVAQTPEPTEVVPADWTPDPELQKYVDQKQALVDQYAEVGQGKVSMSTYDAALDDFYADDTNKELHHPDSPQ